MDTKVSDAFLPFLADAAGGRMRMSTSSKDQMTSLSASRRWPPSQPEARLPVQGQYFTIALARLSPLTLQLPNWFALITNILGWLDWAMTYIQVIYQTSSSVREPDFSCLKPAKNQPSSLHLGAFFVWSLMNCSVSETRTPRPSTTSMESLKASTSLWRR